MIEKEKKLALKKYIAELITKYNALATQSARFCSETEPVYMEMLVDIKKIDAICKERNKY